MSARDAHHVTSSLRIAHRKFVTEGERPSAIFLVRIPPHHALSKKASLGNRLRRGKRRANTGLFEGGNRLLEVQCCAKGGAPSAADISGRLRRSPSEACATMGLSYDRATTLTGGAERRVPCTPTDRTNDDRFPVRTNTLGARSELTTCAPHRSAPVQTLPVTSSGSRLDTVRKTYAVPLRRTSKRDVEDKGSTHLSIRGRRNGHRQRLKPSSLAQSSSPPSQR